MIQYKDGKVQPLKEYGWRRELRKGAKPQVGAMLAKFLKPEDIRKAAAEGKMLK